MKKNICLQFTIYSLLFSMVQAQDTINVPQDYPGIQQGIEAATDGDIVLVDSGTYLENINFMGKAITVASHFIMDGDTNHINNTVIDGSQPSNPDYGSTVMLITGEDTTSVLCGLTITGGSGLLLQSYGMRVGGGVISYFAGVKLLNNKIINNNVSHSGYAGGGGVACFSTSDDNWMVARNNLISGNSCSASAMGAFAGGVYAASDLIFEDNEISYNQCLGTANAQANGCGIFIEEQSGTALVFNLRYNDVHHNSGEGYEVHGAGIWIWGGEGTVSGNSIRNNSGTAVNVGAGGGMKLYALSGVIHITGNEILSNFLEGNKTEGGGIEVIAGQDTVYISNNSILQNNLVASYATWGGGIDLLANQEVLISNNLIQNNILEGTVGNQGAGFWNEGAGATVQLRNNVFDSNSGSGHGYGGGIGFFNDYEDQVMVEIEGNIFKNNSMRYGGAVCTFNSHDMKISNNVFKENTASSDGGAIILRHYAKGLSDLLLLTDQVTMEHPMRIRNIRSLNQPLIINNTFYSNSADIGGAIYCDEDEEFPVPVTFNSIFWQNQAGTSGDDIYYNGTDTLILSYCDIDTSSGNIYGHWSGVGNIDEDPGFIDDSLHIDLNSPCVNTGADYVEFGGTWYYCPVSDYEGEDRPYPSLYCDPVPDMGADEIEIDCERIALITQNSKLKIQNYPNPAHGIFDLQCTIYNLQRVTLKIYDLQGQEVATVLDRKLPAGVHTVRFDASSLPAGMYLIRLQAGEEAATGKMVVQ